MTLHLHTEPIPGCYRCDLSRHEAETILAEQAACHHPTVTCDDCGAEITTPLPREAIDSHPDGEAANEIAGIVMDVLGWQNLSDRYGIANRVLRWLDTNRPDGLKGGHR